MNYLILIIIAVCGVVLGAFLSQRKKCGLISEQSKKKAENKEKVLGSLSKKEKITNNNVEELCSVSHATAERYLNELEKEGKIIQHGKIGTDVFYTLK